MSLHFENGCAKPPNRFDEAQALDDALDDAQNEALTRLAEAHVKQAEYLGGIVDLRKELNNLSQRLVIQNRSHREHVAQLKREAVEDRRKLENLHFAGLSEALTRARRRVATQIIQFLALRPECKEIAKIIGRRWENDAPAPLPTTNAKDAHVTYVDPLRGIVTEAIALHDKAKLTPEAPHAQHKPATTGILLDVEILKNAKRRKSRPKIKTSSRTVGAKKHRGRT